MKKKSESISAYLPTVLKTLESKYKDDAHKIWELWDNAIGPELAKRVRPHKFRSGKLTVAVDGSAWLGQIAFIAPQMIEAINASIGKALVTSIRGVAAEVAPPQPTVVDSPILREGPLTEEEEKELDDMVAELKDEDLKSAIRKAREASMRRIAK